MKRIELRMLRRVGLVCALWPGLAGAQASYDAVASATVITPPPVVQAPIFAKLRAVAGSRVKGSFTGTLSTRKGQFIGSLRLRLPNPAVGITDAATAGAADVVAELSRQGQVYARCDLFFTSLVNKPLAAKFSLAVIRRQDRVSQQTGLCELAIAPFGQALPTPLAHDALTIKAIAPTGEVVLATGLFAKR